MIYFTQEMRESPDKKGNYKADEDDIDASADEELPERDELEREEPEPEAVVLQVSSSFLQKGRQMPNRPAHLAATFLLMQ